MNDQSPIGPPRGFRDVLPTEARALGDAEILALLGESLERAGLAVCESTLQVGSIALTGGLFAALPGEVRVDVLHALRQGDIAGALNRARGAGMPADQLARATRALTGVESGPEAAELCRVIELARERWPGAVKGWGAPNLAVG